MAYQVRAFDFIILLLRKIGVPSVPDLRATVPSSLSERASCVVHRDEQHIVSASRLLALLLSSP